ncbi:MAG: hypothetical protein KGH63_00365 [Candidatus Micrarchaeota archaeon]|nr:hypothetical protein [Candidatus Micrarchaeota archaeon]
MLLTAPDGTVQTLPLQNGQLSVAVEQPGLWLISIGSERSAVEVAAAPSPAPPISASLPAPLLVLFSAALLVMLALAAAAAWSVAFPPAAPHAPALSKRRQWGEVHVCFRAGSAPLRRVVLCDQPGPHWEGPPPRLQAAHLPAGEALHLRYAYDGPLGEARADFVLGSQSCELRCAQGESAWHLPDQMFPATHSPDRPAPAGLLLSGPAHSPHSKAGAPRRQLPRRLPANRPPPSI